METRSALLLSICGITITSDDDLPEPQGAVVVLKKKMFISEEIENKVNLFY